MSSQLVEVENGLIPGLPSTAYYLPHFINADEEQRILHEISKLPQTRWTVLSRRKLLSIPSPLTGSARDTLIDAPLPPYLLDPVVTRLKGLGIFSESPHGAPNHVLVNEYKP